MPVSPAADEIVAVSKPIGIKLMGLLTTVEFSVLSEQCRVPVSPAVSSVATVSTPSPVPSCPAASVAATKQTSLISSARAIVVATVSKQTLSLLSPDSRIIVESTGVFSSAAALEKSAVSKCVGELS
jgi:hypothetical protein